MVSVTEATLGRHFDDENFSPVSRHAGRSFSQFTYYPGKQMMPSGT